MESTPRLSQRAALGARVIYAALQILDEKSGKTSNRNVFEEVERHVTFNDWEQETLKSGDVRWRVILNFESIYCVKAGFLIRKNGMWSLTSEGKTALELGKFKLRKAAIEAYYKTDR